MKTRTLPLTLALTASIGAVGIAQAADNPFALSALPQGYQVATADKAKDGKCGEGKCGGKKVVKPQDGKCGEGKCGGTKKDTKAGGGK